MLRLLRRVLCFLSHRSKPPSCYTVLGKGLLRILAQDIKKPCLLPSLHRYIGIRLQRQRCASFGRKGENLDRRIPGWGWGDPGHAMGRTWCPSEDLEPCSVWTAPVTLFSSEGPLLLTRALRKQSLPDSPWLPFLKHPKDLLRFLEFRYSRIYEMKASSMQ